MAIHKAFLGHGIFTEYSINNALGRFESYGDGIPAASPDDRISRFVKAMQDMEISSVWIQLFTRGQKFDMDPASASLREGLIVALGKANISWAGWGYCAGDNWKRDQNWIADFRKDLGMQAFVIDAEPEEDENKDVWTEENFRSFVTNVNGIFGKDKLALSTWPALQLREPSVTKLIKIAAPQVALIAPQAYWMNYPIDVHYNTLGYKKKDYPPDNPVAFVRLVIQAWKDAGIQTPLVITGQVYWGENAATSEKTMAQKVDFFVKDFKDWDKILGFNWYHAGKTSAQKTQSMSKDMIESIKNAKLGGKPYKSPL